MKIEERLEEINKRGVNVKHLLSDWCIDCIHSIRITNDVCATGCNGISPFYLINGMRIFAEKSTPLKYEKEEKISVDTLL